MSLNLLTGAILAPCRQTARRRLYRLFEVELYCICGETTGEADFNINLTEITRGDFDKPLSVAASQTIDHH
jgi:hypothetical protein